MFDEARYRREVLDAGLPVTGDLRTRYQLPLPPAGVAVAEAVAAVRACWRRHRSRLKYRPVIEELEAGYLLHRPLLDAAADGDATALLAALDAHGRRAEERSARLRGALEEAAGGLGLLTEGTVAEIAAAHQADEELVRSLLPELGLRQAEPDPLPALLPHPAYAHGAAHLRVLGLRHLADFLSTGTPGGRAGSAVRVFDAPPVDRAALDAAAARWGRLPHGAAHTAGQALVAALRTVLTDLGPAGCAALQRHELAAPLRALRAARAAPGTLLAHAVDTLGVAGDDARRLVFAVLHEGAAHPQAERLDRLVSAGRLAEAAAVADRMPADALTADVRALAGYARATLTEARALTDRARGLPPGEADAAWDLLERAEALVRDLPETDAVRRTLAVAPVTGLTAHPKERGVTVRWRPSPSTAGEPEYTLLRGEHRPPTGPEDGAAVRIPLPTARATGCVDTDPPPCTPLYYAVAVRRAAGPGGPFSPLAVCGPVVHRPEVGAVALTAGDGQVTAVWSCPSQALAVEVTRVAPDGGEVRVAARRHGFTDGGLDHGTTYRYLLRAVYREDDGRTVRTDGVWHTATPLAPPEPVSALDVVEPPAGTGAPLVRCAAPPEGEVRLYAFDGPPPWPAGTRLAAAELTGRRLPGRRDGPAGGVVFGPVDRPAVVLAVTVAGDRAVVGGHAAVCPGTLGTPSLSRRTGRGVTVVFHWPPGGGEETEVRWRPHPRDGGGEERRVSVTRAVYRHDGGVVLPVPEDAGVEVEVRPVVTLGGLRARGAPVRAALAARVGAGYRLVVGGLPGRRTATAVFTASATVHAGRLLLVRSRGDLWPLDPGDGEILAQTGDVTLGPGREVRLSARLPRGGGGWVRCFAEGAPAALRDPPRHTLRVR